MNPREQRYANCTEYATRLLGELQILQDGSSEYDNFKILIASLIEMRKMLFEIKEKEKLRNG